MNLHLPLHLAHSVIAAAMISDQYPEGYQLVVRGFPAPLASKACADGWIKTLRAAVQYAPGEADKNALSVIADTLALSTWPENS